MSAPVFPRCDRDVCMWRDATGHDELIDRLEDGTEVRALVEDARQAGRLVGSVEAFGQVPGTAVWFSDVRFFVAGHNWTDPAEMTLLGATLLEVFEDAGAAQAGRQLRDEINWHQLPVLLGYISELGYEELGLMPTALVYQVGQDQPAPGFFKLAASLGLLPADQAPGEGDPDGSMTEAQRKFWDSQVEGLLAHFAA